MRIGILTFHRAANYGAVLQAYALQTVLTNRGHQVEVINYRGDRVDKAYAYKTPFVSYKNGNFVAYIKYLVVSIVSWPLNVVRRRVFDAFLETKLYCTSECFNSDELFLIQKNMDFLFCGSDQVWNLDVINNDTSYFLDFAPKEKRNAYAVSFGKTEIPMHQKQLYTSLISKMNRISVREISSIKMVEELSKRNVSNVLDPTLLLAKTDWENLTDVNSIDDEYILVYVLYDLINQGLMECVKRMHEKTGLKVVYIGKNRHFKYATHQKAIVGPEEWVRLFMNASYVITNSFHGTAFAVNFHVPFYTFLLQPESRPANVRMKDLLKMLQLEERLIHEKYIGEFDEEIDWAVVDTLLEEYRSKSFEYIRSVESEYE